MKNMKGQFLGIPLYGWAIAVIIAVLAISGFILNPFYQQKYDEGYNKSISDVNLYKGNWQACETAKANVNADYENIKGNLTQCNIDLNQSKTDYNTTYAQFQALQYRVIVDVFIKIAVFAFFLFISIGLTWKWENKDWKFGLALLLILLALSIFLYVFQ
jgi:hypothetical protein